MKITLKNVNYSDFASEETYCFEATVYIDDKRSFRVANSGQGGANRYYSFSSETEMYVYRQVEDINKELNKQTITTDSGIDFPNCLDYVISMQMHNWILRKQAKKLLKKVCIVTAKNHLLSFNIPHKTFLSDREKMLNHIELKHPSSTVLNALPSDEAFKIMKPLL